MNLKEFSLELGKIDDSLKTLRRADFEIEGDVAFVGALRQHLVNSITEIRHALDQIITSLDSVDDMQRIVAMGDTRMGLLGRIQKALTSKDGDDAS